MTSVLADLEALELRAGVPHRAPLRGVVLAVSWLAGTIAGAAAIWLVAAQSGQTLVGYFFALALVVGWALVLRQTIYVLRRVAPALLSRPAIRVLRADSRPPILFLRPFDEDARDRVGVDALTVDTGAGFRAELQVYKAARKLGPFVAIGKPGERLASVGAARLYVPDDEWRNVVSRFIHAARFVFLQVGERPGTVWELLHAMHIDPRRVGLLVPDARVRPLGYLRARETLSAFAGIDLPAEGGGTIVVFDASGAPRLIDAPRSGDVFRALSAHITELPAPPGLQAVWDGPETVTDHELAIAKPGTVDVAKVDRVVDAPAHAHARPEPITPLELPVTVSPEVAGFLARCRARRELPIWVFGTLLLHAILGAAVGSFGPVITAGGAGLIVVAVLWPDGPLDRQKMVLLFGLPTVGGLLTPFGEDTGPVPFAAHAVIVASVLAFRAVYKPRPGAAIEDLKELLEPDQLRADIVVADLLRGRIVGRSMLFGSRWFAWSKGGNLQLVDFDEVLWIYGVAVRSEWPLPRRGFVHARPSTDLTDGIPCRATETTAILEQIAEGSPGAIQGWTQALQNSWEHDTADFLGIVHARKRQLEESRGNSA